MPSRIWSLAEQFALNLQSVVPLVVEFYLLGICTLRFKFFDSVVQLGPVLSNITIKLLTEQYNITYGTLLLNELLLSEKTLI